MLRRSKWHRVSFARGSFFVNFRPRLSVSAVLGYNVVR